MSALGGAADPDGGTSGSGCASPGLSLRSARQPRWSARATTFANASQCSIARNARIVSMRIEGVGFSPVFEQIARRHCPTAFVLAESCGSLFEGIEIGKDHRPRLSWEKWFAPPGQCLIRPMAGLGSPARCSSSPCCCYRAPSARPRCPRILLMWNGGAFIGYASRPSTRRSIIRPAQAPRAIER